MSDRPPLTFAYFPPVPSFELRSDDVADGEVWSERHVADSMGYGGENLSPHLAWAGFPPATRGFAVTIHDPDAPTGSGFWHWCLFDIPASVTELATGAGDASGSHIPRGAHQLRNDAGTTGFVGSAPPPGDVPHRYVTTVHAVDVESLGLTEAMSPAILGFNLRFHGLARAQIVPIFGA